MESNKILQADILDILFEGKNKEYGAYELRKTYNRRLLKAITVTGAVIVLLFVGGMVMGRGPKKQIITPVVLDPTLTAVDDKKVIPPVTPPPVKIVPIKTIAFNIPKVVPDNQVKPEDAPPPQEDLENVKIGNTNVDGKADDGTPVAPSAPGDGGKGLIEEKKPAEPEIWEKVEIDASYPGGMPAWQRFMNKNFRYPDEAQNIELQGTVVVQFVVDEQGNVSNVQAISG
ncbi:MAG: TonB family protein, partial [Bacteroidetes bacterium]|nr:TonB family protein [Bacteroidota bacterium]